MSTMTTENVTPVGPGAWRRPTGKTLFLAVVLVILAAYTEMALEMEWRTVAGRIGAGFFPRIVGVVGLALTLVALVQSMRGTGGGDEEDLTADVEAGEADLGRHPRVLVLVVLASFALLAVFTTLGSIVACALFLAGTLWLLNRGHRLTNAAVTLALPIGCYLLFQSFLNAGLPDGILPRF